MLLGTGNDNLIGMHISDIVPALKGAPLQNLFLPDLGRGPARDRGKGGLKKAQVPDKKAEKKPGPVCSLQIMHFADCEPLDVTLQAFNVGRPKKEICVMLHLVRPTTGPSGFKAMLRDNLPGASRALIAAGRGLGVEGSLGLNMSNNQRSIRNSSQALHGLQVRFESNLSEQ